MLEHRLESLEKSIVILTNTMSEFAPQGQPSKDMMEESKEQPFKEAKPEVTKQFLGDMCMKACNRNMDNKNKIFKILEKYDATSLHDIDEADYAKLKKEFESELV